MTGLWKRYGNLAPLLALLGLSLMGRPALAADTVETWDVGATDVDFYLGAEGLRKGGEQNVSAEIMLGYGLLEGFSAYLGANLRGDGVLANGQGTLFLGLFGTPVDTDHFDLDLFLDVSAGGVGLSDFAISPSLELNYDLTPDLGTWGLYLRAGVPVYGRTVGGAASPSHEAAFLIESTLGTYWTVAPGHQLLLEFDMAFCPDPDEHQHKAEIGGLALGYNVAIHEALELITQVNVDLPQGDEDFSAGLSVGLIATLPSAKP